MAVAPPGTGNFQTSFIPPGGLNAITYSADESSSLLAGRWIPIPRQRRHDTSLYGTPLGTPVTRGFIRLRINELPLTDPLYQSLTP